MRACVYMCVCVCVCLCVCVGARASAWGPGSLVVKLRVFESLYVAKIFVHLPTVTCVYMSASQLHTSCKIRQVPRTLTKTRVNLNHFNHIFNTLYTKGKERNDGS